MNCGFDKELLTAYHDKQLSASEMSTVAAHLQACEECKRTVEEYASLSSMLRSIDAPKVSVQAESEKIMSSPALGREKNIIKFSKYLEFAVAAAACVLVAFIAFSVFDAPKKNSPEPANTMARATEKKPATADSERRTVTIPEAEHASREMAKLPPADRKDAGKKPAEDGKKANSDELAILGKVEKVVSKAKGAAPQENEWGNTVDATETIDDVLALNCVDVEETRSAITQFVLQNGNQFRRAGSNEYVVELDRAQQEQLLAFVGNNCKNKITYNSNGEDYALGAPENRNPAPGADVPDTTRRDEKGRGNYSGKSADPQSKTLPQTAGKGGDFEKKEFKREMDDQTAGGLAPNQQAQKAAPKQEAQGQTLEKLDKDLTRQEGGDKKQQLRIKSALAEENKQKKEEEKTADKIDEPQRSDTAKQSEFAEENFKTLEELVTQLRLNRGRWTFGNRGRNLEQRKSANRQVLLLLNRAEEPSAEPALKKTEKAEGK